MKHLLKMMDLSTEEIIEILNLADQLKYELKHGIPHDLPEHECRRRRRLYPRPD